MEEDDCLVSNLAFQLSELDMLSAMLNDDELILDQPGHVADMREVVDSGQSVHSLETSLSFTVRLPINVHDKKDEKHETSSDSRQVEMQISMPEGYPAFQMADMYVKSSFFTRESQRELNSQLQEHFKDSWSPNELCVGNAISWTQEHAFHFFQSSSSTSSPSSSSSSSSQKRKDELLRLWIYSHHIYSRIKRKNILDLAADNRITGFSMPGKPGIVCLEGRKEDVNDVWASIKSWNWKKINVKIQEEVKCDGIKILLDSQRRFCGFEEIGTVKNIEARDYHMDMGKFFEYLKGYNSEYIFKELFGFDKK